jgi:hypothetical protein
MLTIFTFEVDKKDRKDKRDRKDKLFIFGLDK